MQSSELCKSSTEELTNLNNSLSSSVENNSNLNNKKDELTGPVRPPPNLNSQLSVLSAKTDDESINLNIIPETSYSSSDDEDFFFDAEEEAHQQSFGGASKGNSTLRLEQKLSKTKIGTNFNHSNALNELKLQQSSLQEKDYDACYEDDNEDELGSLEGHGSVISHLISQVKIGMDLTKVSSVCALRWFSG